MKNKNSEIELFNAEKNSFSTKSPKEAFINIRNYLAGQHIGATRDDTLLDETIKCLFCKLLIEKNKLDIDFEQLDTFELAKQIRSIFNEVRGLFFDIFQEDTEILLDPVSIKFVMKQLNFSIIDAHSDPIGDAFEIFIGSESKGNSGQFFTPKSICTLLVKILNPQPHELVLDPACGAGGFLSTICSHIVNNKSNSRHNFNEFVSNNLFGIDKDSYLSKLAKAHISLLTGINPTVLNADSLFSKNGISGLESELPKKGFDIILTNPPFGSKIISANAETLKDFTLSRKWVLDKNTNKYNITDKIQNNVPPQILFIERCISLLRYGGKLGIVLPESVISSKSYSYVVQFILSNIEIDAIIGMPESLFKTSGKGGTHTKTCLLIGKKVKNIRADYKIYMAEAKWCGKDSRARIIPNNDIPTIQDEFSKYQVNKDEYLEFGFTISRKDIINNILCPRYYDTKIVNDLDKLNYDCDIISIDDLIKKNVLTYQTGNEVGKLSYGTGTIPFIRTSDISNSELKSDPKHCVSEEVYNKLKEKQDVKVGDILMVKDGTYLIGTSAIITEEDTKIIYQSHLYKIRVLNNDIGLNSYLLLALLNSDYVQAQIKSKQFTQDIIDSLGSRISEIKIPIPKSPQIRQSISELVQQSIEHRINAKRLYQKAKNLILSNLK